MSWWNGSWSYRKKLTIGNAAQGQLDNFTVLVSLNVGNFTFAHAKSAGADIRFVDDNDTDELKYEIEKWVDNTEAWIWVKVPVVTANSATDFIYMYYGNAAASDNQDAANTWDANYKAVYHLNKEANAVVDSKGAHNGTNYGATRGQAGQIDSCFSFDGTDDYVDCGEGAGDFDLTAAWTLEAWAKADVARGTSIIRKCDFTDGVPTNFAFNVMHDGYDIVAAFDNPDNTWRTLLIADAGMSTGTLYYVVSTWDGTYIRVYVDGVLKGTSSDFSATPPRANDYNLRLGSYPPVGTFDGLLDEVRISNIAKSADYATAQYLSMTLAFMTFGSEEAGVVSKSSSDTGTGAESLGSRLFDAAETGSGIGASSLLAALIGTQETGLGSEFATKVFSAFDSGSGIDAVISRLLAATETGSALEVALLITVLISGDGGLGSDLSTLLKAILASDEGSGFDALTALIEFPTTGSDMRLHASPGQVRIPSKGVNL